MLRVEKLKDFFPLFKLIVMAPSTVETTFSSSKVNSTRQRKGAVLWSERWLEELDKGSVGFSNGVSKLIGRRGGREEQENIIGCGVFGEFQVVVCPATILATFRLMVAVWADLA